MLKKYHSHMKYLFLLGTLVGWCQVAQANLVTNGSFELGSFLPDSNGVMSLPAGSSTMVGWIVTGHVVSWMGNPNTGFVSASEGNNFVDLTDYSIGPVGGVSQTIPTTVGLAYELSFDLGSSTIWGRPSAIQVNASSTSNVFSSSTTGGNSDWDRFSMQFIANSSETIISFIGANGVHYIGLDNVAVSAVPIPAPVILFVSGLVGLFTFANRRRGQSA